MTMSIMVMTKAKGLELTVTARAFGPCMRCRRPGKHKERALPHEKRADASVGLPPEEVPAWAELRRSLPDVHR